MGESTPVPVGNAVDELSVAVSGDRAKAWLFHASRATGNAGPINQAVVRRKIVDGCRSCRCRMGRRGAREVTTRRAVERRGRFALADCYGTQWPWSAGC